MKIYREEIKYKLKLLISEFLNNKNLNDEEKRTITRRLFIQAFSIFFIHLQRL
jgi:hypothetical protein